MTELDQKPKNKFFIPIILLLIIGGGVYYWLRKDEVQSTKAGEEYRALLDGYTNMTRDNVDFSEIVTKAETLLARYENRLKPNQEGHIKTVMATSLPAKERTRAVATLQEVAENEQYPHNIRAFAINSLMDDFEMNFASRDFTASMIFRGSFERFLRDAQGNEKLALRKLNERSVALFPNAAAYYRIALSHAEELTQAPGILAKRREELRVNIASALDAGDKLFSDQTPRERQGLVYTLKARTLHLAGDKKEAEKFFQMAREKFLQPPVIIFQILYRAPADFYYAAFLGRNFGQSRKEEIQSILKQTYDFLATPQPVSKRNIRLVSFLTAARDSHDASYPAPDFNKIDIKRLGTLYPELGSVIAGLDLEEYQKAP